MVWKITESEFLKILAKKSVVNNNDQKLLL